MDRRLYLHIGMGRCGSRSVQTTLAANRDRLASVGFAYPLSETFGPDLARSGGNSTGFAVLISDAGMGSPVGQRATEALIEGLLLQREPNVILSTEFMWTWTDEDLSLLKQRLERAGFEIVVVTYLREQREWLVSLYAQALKRHRRTLSLEEHIRKKYKSPALDYSRQFERLQRVFRPCNIIIRLFDRESLVQADVRKDFLAALGIECEGFVFSSDRSNVSANVIELEILRTLNKHPPDRDFDNGAFLDFAWGYWKSQGAEPSRALYRLVSPEFMGRMGIFFSRRNEAFRTDYLPEKDPPLFRSTIPEQYTEFTEADKMSEQTILLMQHYAIHLRERAERKRILLLKRAKRQETPRSAILGLSL